MMKTNKSSSSVQGKHVGDSPLLLFCLAPGGGRMFAYDYRKLNIVVHTYTRST